MKRKIVLLVAMIVVLFIGYNFVNRIYAALKAGDRLTQALDNLHQVEIKNKDLKEQLKLAASLDFVERQARDKLNIVNNSSQTISGSIGSYTINIPPNKTQTIDATFGSYLLPGIHNIVEAEIWLQ